MSPPEHGTAVVYWLHQCRAVPAASRLGPVVVPHSSVLIHGQCTHFLIQWVEVLTAAIEYAPNATTIRFASYTVLQQQIPPKPPSHLFRKAVVPFGIENYHCWTIKTTSLPSLNNSLFHKPVTTTLADNERCNKCRLVVGSQPFCPNRHAANNIPRLGTTPDPVHIGGANTPTPSAYVE